MANQTLVIALGGNAILQPKQKGTFEIQYENVKSTAEHLCKIITQGYRLVIIHGNGPQIGNILLQNELAGSQVPSMPLGALGAESQGLIGLMIQQNLRNALQRAGLDIPVVTLLSQVVVDADDPAFEEPTKPIGSFHDAEYARQKIELGESWIEDSGRGWRRVVPSPKPRDIVELPTVKAMLTENMVITACGGGGIPVIDTAEGLQNIEAVIDKDLVASHLAAQLQADGLIILTDVAKVAINYGKPNQTNLDTLTVNEARRLLQEGEFDKGSMGPKVEGAADFVASGGKSVIARLDEASLAVEGVAGTKFVLDKDAEEEFLRLA